MKNETNEILLSQLADGELDSDQANGVLLDVLDDAEKRRQMKELLRLRQSLAYWRRQEPTRPGMVPSGSPVRPRHWRLRRQLGSLIAAMVIGGVLVMAGFWTAVRIGRTTRIEQDVGNARVPAIVTPEQMRQVASVFALHESVAGPLKWYAADDQRIQLASAAGEEIGHKPVAVLLRLVPAAKSQTAAKTYVIVCRDNLPVTIDLCNSNGVSAVRLCLTPVATRSGKVQMQYALAVTEPQYGRDVSATLTGQRRVGLYQTPLGQIALADEMLNVDASAWVIPGGKK